MAGKHSPFPEENPTLDSRRITFQIILLLIIILGVLAGLTWANYRFTESNPGGNDFLVHWVGTRAFLIDGISPYSDEVAERIQTLAYGRPAQPGEHELRVAYPLYSVILFAPFALVPDYTLARAIWMTILEIGLFFLIIASLWLTTWKPSLWLLVFYFIFAFLWYHSIRPLVLGNAVILVGLFIALALLAIRAQKDELAGVLLAFATIKPQLLVLFIIYIFFWAGFNGRWRIITATLISIVILTVAGMFFIPDWILQNLREVLRYPGYNPPGTMGAALTEFMPGVGRQLGWALTGFLVLLLLWEWVRSNNKPFRWFLWTACLTLVASQWIGVQTDPGNFIILLPVLVLVFAVWDEAWGTAGRFFILSSMLILGVGIWWLFIETVGEGPQPQQSAILFFPLPLFLLLCLYWVRWWAVRAKKPLLDQIKKSVSH
jgi:hypothetical protein